MAHVWVIEESWVKEKWYPLTGFSYNTRKEAISEKEEREINSSDLFKYRVKKYVRKE